MALSLSAVNKGGINLWENQFTITIIMLRN